MASAPPVHPYYALSVTALPRSYLKRQSKARHEGCAVRLMMNSPHEIPSRLIDFYKLIHRAQFYGRGGHEADFDFLLEETGGTTTLAAMEKRTLSSGENTDEDHLAFLIARLRNLELDAIAVDLTTDELRDVGLWVVCVIIPQLMPITFIYRARYLGPPRLYDYIGRVKGSAFTEADVNTAPLPFA
jgi:ribosomal protein S12 methylthiotransferase accessory factor